MVHLASFGGAAVSISVIHVRVPVKLWLVLGAATVCALGGFVLIVIHVYALLGQRPEDREEGESAWDFYFRRMQERDSDW